ncbi:MAG TPA: hypothetical protein VH879_01535 [Gemmatimonadales bacterium]|jgi:hypothetical protein
MVLKLSAKQQSQLAFLELLPPKFHRVQNVIEQMSSPKIDETAVRGMIRVLDEMKAHASQLSLNNLADALGAMASVARRGGGQQVKVRGLRDLIGPLRTNYDAAVKKASVPEADVPHDQNQGSAPSS